MKKECPDCGEKLEFRFGPCDYICHCCNKRFTEHQINLLYGEVDY